MAGVGARELELLYRSRWSHFVRVATALLRDEERAADVVQDAFATALARRRDFRGDGPLEAWVWRIVVNAARKAAVARAPAPAAEETTARPAPGASPLRDAIVALPERQRLVLFLRYYADLDYGAIAAALEVAPGTVAASLHAAHASLRRTLEEVRP